ncbi:MAG: hypothetical protein EOO50_01065 [Flavobacterium sp.]|uniref:hypothetical protein n=1 Tax=Flavobacterium sp. TaxID=239 RepID=UPI0011F99805|nr:hypothetical protein [Flavobacterium sp.]RZJ68412.1 MAG: hypothetical protein EOO50_01065 [Flavobacterium sp.]
MDIIYQPNLGLSINDATITWGMNRDQVRELLKVSFEEDNTTFDLSDLFDDEDDDFDFSQNRDIYSGLASAGDSIFLSYDKKNALTEFEMHEGIAVSIHDFRFYQDQPMHEIVTWFRQNNFNITQVEPGNFAVAELKISVASHNAMGGQGDNLSYLYASNDVSHLID